MTRISRTIVAGLSALAMAAAVVLPVTPAAAQWRGGGFHGGGWHGGGWGGRGVWHGGYWRGGYGYGGGCWQVRPTYDGYGNYLGQQSVNVCQ